MTFTGHKLFLMRCGTVENLELQKSKSVYASFGSMIISRFSLNGMFIYVYVYSNYSTLINLSSVAPRNLNIIHPERIQFLSSISPRNNINWINPL